MLTDVLNKFGRIGVAALKESIASVRATGTTERSIHYIIETKQQITTLAYLGRNYFRALETGRGPAKKQGGEGDFKERIYQWMLARGIGSELPEKKRKQLAAFFVYKINKEGDSIYKEGGRTNYSPVIAKLVAEIKQAVKQDFIHTAITRIRHVANPGNKTTTT
jgi:hypothetical protein